MAIIFVHVDPMRVRNCSHKKAFHLSFCSTTFQHNSIQHSYTHTRTHTYTHTRTHTHQYITGHKYVRSTHLYSIRSFTTDQLADLNAGHKSFYQQLGSHNSALTGTEYLIGAIPRGSHALIHSTLQPRICTVLV